MEKIEFNRDLRKEEINWSYKTAIKKTKNTRDSWKNRSDIQRFLDIFLGDLAKNLVIFKLKEIYPKIEIIEYDKIRKDDFKNPDLYDFKINNLDIEIKSSIEKYTKDISIMKKTRNIIFNKNNEHEKISDFVFQVFFLPDDLKFLKSISDGKFNNYNLEEFVKEKMKEVLKLEVYIAGFVNKHEINKEKEIYIVENKSINDKKREYIKLNINKSHRLNEFREEFKKYINVLNEKRNNKKLKY